MIDNYEDDHKDELILRYEIIMEEVVEKNSIMNSKIKQLEEDIGFLKKLSFEINDEFKKLL